MTTLETADLFHVNERTVKNWCTRGLIRGLTKNEQDEFVIPLSVKRPYSGTRSKGDGIYISIVKGVMGGFDVTPGLFRMSNNEFNHYIQQLLAAEVVDFYVDETTGIRYLCRTLKSSDFAKLRKNKVKAFFQSIKMEGNVNIGINIGV